MERKWRLKKKKTYEFPLCFYSYERPSLYKERQDTVSSNTCTDLKGKKKLKT